MKRIAWLIVMGVLAVATAANAGTWYVATNATHTYDGSAWDVAFTNVQDALDNAASNDTIYVAGHTFGLSTQLVWTTSYVTVRGGYAATNAADLPGPSDPARWPTVIQRASGTNRILYVKGVTNGTLDQVTLTGGNVGNGGGLRIDGSTNFLLSGSTVQSNAFVAGWNNGAGIYIAADSAVTVSNCMVRNNTGNDPQTTGAALAKGGGIYSAGILTVRDSAIVQNEIKATGWGQAWGGGICVGGGRLDAKNVLLDNNKAKTYGAGVQVDAGTANLGNWTIVNHAGQGLRRAGGTLGVTNCIFWQNATDTNGAMTVSYSLIGSDPKFEYGYYLGAGSPATNAGSDTAANLGLQNYAKNAAGAAYGGAETVNLGYHYKTGADMTYADIYVAPESLGGNDGNNGTNAATPFKTMTKALAMATDGTRIHVAAGTYGMGSGETFPLTVSGKLGVQVIGTNAAATVFDAVGSGARVLALTMAHGMAMENLTIRRGTVSNSGGGGLRIMNSLNVMLSGCVVETNSSAGGYEYGAGIYVSADSTAALSNCTVRGNTATSGSTYFYVAYGGGVYSAGTLLVRDSIFVNNKCGGSGYNYGGAIYAGGRLDLRNVLVVSNDVSGSWPVPRGDGLYMAGTVGLTNVTVAGNLGEGLRRDDGTVTVKDSILWGNGVDSTGTVTISWSCISNSTDYVDGGSNITVNPLFVDTTYYHLQSRAGNYVGGYFDGGVWERSSASSPCIDAGDPTSDYLREPQPNGRRVNMGCYGNTPVASLNADPRGNVFMIR